MNKVLAGDARFDHGTEVVLTEDAKGFRERQQMRKILRVRLTT